MSDWSGVDLNTYGPWASQGGSGAYQPPADQEQPGADPNDLTFKTFSKANNYEAMPYQEKLKLWNKYRDGILPEMAVANNADLDTLRTIFEKKVPKPTLEKRGVLGAASDYGNLIAKGVNGALKSVSDVAGADNGVSQFFADNLSTIESNLSDEYKDELKRQQLEKDALGKDAGFADKAALTAKHIARNPGAAIAEGVGNVLPMIPGGLLGIGTKGMVLLSSLMGIGAVKGGIYDTVMNAPQEELDRDTDYQRIVESGVSPKDAREQVAILRQSYADNPGKIATGGAVGALMGRFGVTEQALANMGKAEVVAELRKRVAEAGIKGTVKAGAKESAQEAPQEMLETYLGNTGAASGGASIDSMQGVAEAGVSAAAMSLVPGAGSHYVGGRVASNKLKQMGLDPNSTLEDDLLSGDPPDSKSIQDLPQETNVNSAPSTDGVPVGSPSVGFDPAKEIRFAATLGGNIGGRVAEVNARYLQSAWDTGGEDAVAELAAQNNSVGAAARSFLRQIESKRAPLALPAPEAAPPTPMLPAPDSGSGVMQVGEDGQVTEQSFEDNAAAMRRNADVYRNQLETGLTPDVIQAQAARAASQDATTNPEGAGGNSGREGADGASASERASTGELSNVGPDGQALKHVVLQNRDRESAASVAQMHQIAARPDYARVSVSRQLSEGAPVVIDEVNIPEEQRGRVEVVSDSSGRRMSVRYAVVDADSILASHTADGLEVKGYDRGVNGKVRAVAGNGRVAGLQRAYTNGRALQYRTDMMNDMAGHGIDPQAISGMKAPVLVRTMSPADVTSDIGDRTNTSGVSQLSPVEQAKNDARRVDVGQIEFTDDGDPTPDSVRRFVQGMPDSEKSGLIDQSGAYGRQAVDRLMAAVFWKAYGDQDMVQLYAQASDPDAKNVLSGMADAAGLMVQLDGSKVDIRDAVVDAAKAAINARRNGVSMAEFAKTRDMTMGADAHAIVEFLAANIRSPKRIAEGLKNAAQFALDNQGGVDMFGDVQPASREQIVDKLRDGNDTRTTEGNADAGRSKPAEVDAGRDGKPDSADEQGSGNSTEAASENELNKGENNGTQAEKTKPVEPRQQAETGVPRAADVTDETPARLSVDSKIVQLFDESANGRGLKRENANKGLGKVVGDVRIVQDQFDRIVSDLESSGRIEVFCR